MVECWSVTYIELARTNRLIRKRLLKRLRHLHVWRWEREGVRAAAERCHSGGEEGDEAHFCECALQR
jgi:hypothetical protein